MTTQLGEAQRLINHSRATLAFSQRQLDKWTGIMKEAGSLNALTRHQRDALMYWRGKVKADRDMLANMKHYLAQ